MHTNIDIHEYIDIYRYICLEFEKALILSSPTNQPTEKRGKRKKTYRHYLCITRTRVKQA